MLAISTCSERSPRWFVASCRLSHSGYGLGQVRASRRRVHTEDLRTRMAVRFSDGVKHCKCGQCRGDAFHRAYLDGKNATVACLVVQRSRRGLGWSRAGTRASRGGRGCLRIVLASPGVRCDSQAYDDVAVREGGGSKTPNGTAGCCLTHRSQCGDNDPHGPLCEICATTPPRDHQLRSIRGQNKQLPREKLAAQGTRKFLVDHDRRDPK